MNIIFGLVKEFGYSWLDWSASLQNVVEAFTIFNVSIHEMSFIGLIHL